MNKKINKENIEKCEQLQEDLITYCEGLSEELIDNLCDVVVAHYK